MTSTSNQRRDTSIKSHFHYSFSQQAEEDNEQKKRHEQMMMEKLIEQEAMMEQEDQKVKRKGELLYTIEVFHVVYGAKV